MNIFGLTSPALPWIAAGVSSLILIGGIFFIPRLTTRRIRFDAEGNRRRGPGVLPYVAQAVVLILVPVLFATTVFLYLNRSYQWYASWPDVLGSSGGPAVTQTQGGPQIRSGPMQQTDAQSRGLNIDAQGVKQQPGSAQHTASLAKLLTGINTAKAAKHGVYLTHMVAGSSSHMKQKVLVWLPPQYFSQPTKQFPVLMGYPGYPAGPQAYQFQMNMGKRIIDYSRSAKAVQPILVVPDVNPGMYDSECLNGTQGKNASATETWITKDVVGWVKKNLRVHTSPYAWSNIGYSAGGWCSNMLTMRHPDIFRYSLSYSGYFEPWFSPRQHWLPKTDDSYKLAKIAEQKRPPVDLWFYAGGNDHKPLASLQKFRGSVKAPTSLTTVIKPIGGHRMAVWLPGIEPGLMHLHSLSAYFRAP